MGLVLVTATIATPVVLGGDFSLDGLLVAAHPAWRLAPPGPETTGAALPEPAIPVVRCSVHGASARLASIAEPSPDARVVSDYTVKRRDGEDLQSLARSINLGLGPGKNRMHKHAALVTRSLSWYGVGDRRGMLKLLRRITHVGGWRAAGYGVVTNWSAEYVADDPARALVNAEGEATRPLPIAWCADAETTTRGALVAPYWHPQRQTETVVPAGTRCTLTPETLARVSILADPTVHRDHAQRHNFRRVARAADAARDTAARAGDG